MYSIVLCVKYFLSIERMMYLTFYSCIKSYFINKKKMCLTYIIIITIIEYLIC